MRIALEGFVLLNLLMNGFALLMSARVASCKRIRPGKILCGAWAGTLYALLAYTWPPARTVLFFPVSLLMAACIAPQMRVRVLLRCAGILIGCTFLLGGTGYALMQAFKSRKLALALGTPVALYCVFRLERTPSARIQADSPRGRLRRGDGDVLSPQGVGQAKGRLVRGAGRHGDRPAPSAGGCARAALPCIKRFVKT